jgi:hypothetical protein
MGPLRWVTIHSRVPILLASGCGVDAQSRPDSAVTTSVRPKNRPRRRRMPSSRRWTERFAERNELLLGRGSFGVCLEGGQNLGARFACSGLGVKPQGTEEVRGCEAARLRSSPAKQRRKSAWTFGGRNSGVEHRDITAENDWFRRGTV